MREDRPNLNRGDRVCVREPGIRSWLATVVTLKPAKGYWRVEVRRDDSGITWSIPASMVTLEGVRVDA